MRLESGSLVYGNVQIAITATYAGNEPLRGGVASCGCAGGDTNGNVNNSDNTDARVEGVAGSVLKVGTLNVNAEQYNTGLRLLGVAGRRLDRRRRRQRRRHRRLRAEHLLGVDDVPARLAESDLVVDSTGKIVTDINVPVTDDLGNSYSLGDTIPVGRVIEVGDLVNSGSGDANFFANDLNGLRGPPRPATRLTPPPIGHIWGNDGTFIVRDAWDNVTLTNYSSRRIVTHLIEVRAPGVRRRRSPSPSRTSRARRTRRRTTSRCPRIPPPGATIEFDIKHHFPPTFVQILNLQPGAIANSDVDPRRDDRQPDRDDGRPERPRQHLLRARQSGATVVRDEHAPSSTRRTARSAAPQLHRGVGRRIACPPRSPIVLHLVKSQYVDGSGTHERADRS